MSVAPTPTAQHGHGAAHGHGSRRGYLVGGVLSAMLTTIPFWLVMRGPTPGEIAWIAAGIAACAMAQILVHTFCFLHVDTRVQGGWTLLAFVFTAVLVIITIGGSLWIMYHLNSNMMPMGDGMAPGSFGTTR